MPTEDMGNRAVPQPPDVASGLVIAAVAGFLAFVAIAMTALLFYLKAGAPEALRQAVEHPFPAPALQKSPHDDLKQIRREQRSLLSSYAWIDQSNGLVRIPIEEAMRIIASRGSHAYDAPGSSTDDPNISKASGAQP